jgi:hypothetical protein
VLDLDRKAGGVCAASEVEEAAGVVGEEDSGAGGADVGELAFEDALAEFGGGEGGGAAETAADLGFCKRDDLGAGEAANELIDGVTATEGVGALAESVDGDGAAVAACEAAVGEAGRAGKVFGEVVDAALEGASAGGPDGVTLEEALVVVKHGDGTGRGGCHDIAKVIGGGAEDLESVASHAAGVVVVAAVDGGEATAVLFIRDDDFAAGGTEKIRSGNGNLWGESIRDALEEERDASSRGARL